MEMKIFTVYDNVAEVYLRPFFCLNTGEAIRTFSDLVNDPNTPFAKHPTDYALYELGGYNDMNGLVHPKNPEPLRLVTASDMRQTPTLVTQEGEQSHG